MLSIVAMTDSDGNLLTREQRLRTGFYEEVKFGSRSSLTLSWGPHFPDTSKPAVQDFVIEHEGITTPFSQKEYIHDFEEAIARFAYLERKLLIEEAALALLGPQDTVKIVKPPKH